MDIEMCGIGKWIEVGMDFACMLILNCTIRSFINTKVGYTNKSMYLFLTSIPLELEVYHHLIHISGRLNREVT
jgi:hypothetical protein